MVEPHVCPFRVQPLCGTVFPFGGESALDCLCGIARIDWIRRQRRFRRVGVQHPMRRRILSGLLTPGLFPWSVVYRGSPLAQSFFGASYVLMKGTSHSYDRFLQSLMLSQEDGEDGDDTVFHTTYSGDTIRFVPSELATNVSNKRIHSQAALALRPCCHVEQIQIVVDCTLLTGEMCKRIWKKSSWKDIRIGFRLFRDLPCSIRSITVIRPRQGIPYWDRIMSMTTSLLSKKLQGRLRLI